ncbi:MAG: 2,3-bisphosphoglycerate-independent phosphoglycerate mutase [Candidatus Heimdallarchaeota archaeon]
MRALLIIADGMGDRLIPELGDGEIGKTPLEATETPSLDELARRGINGLVDVIRPGIIPGSDTAHLSLFGYNAFKTYSGRGALEALGVGLQVKKGDVAFRCNLATVENGVIIDRRAGRISEEGDELIQALQGIRSDISPDTKIIVKHTVEHRCAMILRGPDISPKVSPTDPKKNEVKIARSVPLEETKAAYKTSMLLNELSDEFYNILSAHPINSERQAHGLLPANCILFRGGGTVPDVIPLPELYKSSCAFIAPSSLVAGVAIAVGMKPIEVPGATGTYNTDHRAKATRALAALESNDFVFIHFKPTDNASHDGNVALKQKMIQKVDEIAGIILDANLPDLHIAICADHCTPLRVREHTADPVPLAIMGSQVRTDDIKVFDERSAVRGALQRLRGHDIIPILMNLIGHQKMFGA